MCHCSLATTAAYRNNGWNKQGIVIRNIIDLLFRSPHPSERDALMNCQAFVWYAPTQS